MKRNVSFSLKGNIAKEALVEYAYMRFGFIKCYHTAVLTTRIIGERMLTEAEIKELIFQRYGHKVKSIINITI